jgi:hypothetical protein
VSRHADAKRAGLLSLVAGEKRGKIIQSVAEIKLASTPSGT